ncbi:uncharacterized protein LAJ45_08972 [Morchella importuna]|uniref:uncharacterized protein n=1 Tax=Morchella importuna TaxID=1174673 RepID=UPI001E8E7537|nr:uncharacterized protein LAJ45_08972 [Morchella importuna]KAH8146893.1 hypothetical protein LAJ45_08972 [Morchella importuna]
MASPANPCVHVLSQLSASTDVRSDPEPRIPTKPKSTTFRHPGYPDGHDVMFSLQALDRVIVSSQPQSDEVPVWGIHHRTAVQACSIVACNVSGVLSSCRLDADVPAPATDIPPDAVLTAPRTDFENWRFPHTNIPPKWLVMESDEFEGSPPAPRTRLV